jgi:hypothetical protein
VPAREGRHARNKDADWGGPPSRSTELAAAVTTDTADPAPAKGPPGRKDTRSWCKGKPGREHKLAIDGEALGTPILTCKWVIRWDRDRDGYAAGWNCLHRERCTECRKVTREGWQLTRAECPLYPGDPAQQQETEQRAAQLGTRRWRRRRPVIDGPQGYRRPKPAGQ